MITLYTWNTTERTGRFCDADLLRTQAAAIHANDTICWINLDDPSEEEEHLALVEFLPVHKLSFLDIVQRHREDSNGIHLPKVEAFPDYLLVIINPLSEAFLRQLDAPEDGLFRCDKDTKAITQLSAVLTKNVLITHHRQPIRTIREIQGYLEKHAEQAARGPDFLFHLILDALIDEFAPALDHVQDALEEMEESVFTNPSQEVLQKLLSLKHNVFRMRKSLNSEREILARLIRGEFELIDEREIVYYRNVYDHVVRFSDSFESAREMINDLMQTHLSAISNRLNEIMKVLTMISTIVLPMTLIAGVYGMNFDFMPELRWPWGYPLALVLMACAGVAGYLFFRWRRWV